MQTRRINLRAFTDEDLPTFFRWRNTEKFRFLFHHDENVVTYEECCAEFVHDSPGKDFQYITERTSNGEVMGLTYVHHLNSKEGSCFVGIFLEERFEGKGYGVDIFLLLARFLFESLKLKRVYVEVFAYNALSLATIRAAGMTEVERFPGQRKHQGEPSDVLHFYYEVERLPEVIALLEKLSSPKIG